jgi:hypothetical protein
MSTRQSILCLSLLTLAALPAGAASTAPAGNPGELRLRTEKVVVFKDGHALFVKSAQGVADARGAVFTREVPEAAVLVAPHNPEEKANPSSVVTWEVSVPAGGARTLTYELVRYQ